MYSVEEALEIVLSRVSTLPSASVPLLSSLGCVLAEQIISDIDNPPFDNSAVDGYAVRAGDVASASNDNPVTLELEGEVSAGDQAGLSVGAGECIRVMTGAPMPAGADAMVMREDAEPRGRTISIRASAQPGDHVRRAGEDFHRGDVVLAAGARIGAAEIGMLAAVGKAEVSVYRRPRVAVFSTGDELVDISFTPGNGQIRDSNRYALEALVHEAGGEVTLSRRLPDDLDATVRAFSLAAGLGEEDAVDVIVTSGGVSVGDRDFVKPALEKLGTLELWRVSMKPGKPLAFGRIENTYFLGLPGNPISTMVTFELFVRPLLRKLAGHSDLFRRRVRAELLDEVSHAPGRREYVRCRLTEREGRIVALPTGAQGSGILSSMLGANALLIVPEHSSGLAAGDVAEALLLDWPEPGDSLQVAAHA
jgi:molybdopterin molybdotransferase